MVAVFFPVQLRLSLRRNRMAGSVPYIERGLHQLVVVRYLNSDDKILGFMVHPFMFLVKVSIWICHYYTMAHCLAMVCVTGIHKCGGKTKYFKSYRTQHTDAWAHDDDPLHSYFHQSSCMTSQPWLTELTGRPPSKVDQLVETGRWANEKKVSQCVGLFVSFWGIRRDFSTATVIYWG